MRTPRILAALIALAFAPLLPAAAQVKTDLGASAAGTGVSAAAGAASNPAAALPVPALDAALAPSALVSAPAASLAPAARPETPSLPASAVLAAPAAAAGPEAEPRTAQEAASAPAPAPPDVPGPVAASAPPGASPEDFAAALQKLGVPAEMIARLAEFLSTRHPGDQDAIYHGLGHSREVAGYAARVVENADLPDSRKILLILAASLHDVDPERAPGTPARVAATLQHLDEDPEARGLVSDYSSRFGFTPEQVRALIMGTDFSADPADMKARQEAFARAAAAAFPGEDFGLVWGRRLAFVDQASTYLGDAQGARRRVEGLAREIRAQLDALGKGPGPTDAQMLAGTGKFLDALRRDASFAVLPSDLQDRFEAVQAYFSARPSPEAWTAAAAPVPARAPPDVQAARRYVASIAAGIKLDERQTDALIGQFFEEHGIPASSPRADAVRRELLPARLAAEDEAVARLTPALRRHRAVLLKLAAQRKIAPADIEAVLARRGVLSAISALDDDGFERQAEFALDRDELESAVAGYPDDDAQGRFMRDLAAHMASSAGKSVEEVARDGVFAYVDFHGSQVRKAFSGRDPDVRSCQVVFYVTRRDGRWRIGGYRQNRETGRGDAELARILKNWLVSGGVPAGDLE